MEPISGIYALLHCDSGRCYIGSTHKLLTRLNDHRSELRKGVHPNRFLQRAWAKYGEHAFIFTILERVQDRELLHVREQYHLDRHQPKVFNMGRIAKAPVTGMRFTRTAEVKAKMSAAMKGIKKSPEHRQKMREYRLGRPHPYTAIQRAKIIAANIARTGCKHSDETRLKLSETHKGQSRPHSTETRALMSAMAYKRPQVPDWVKSRMSESAKRRWERHKQQQVAS